MLQVVLAIATSYLGGINKLYFNHITLFSNQNPDKVYKRSIFYYENIIIAYCVFSYLIMRNKQTCKLCGKQLINLTRHMYMVHGISLSNVREAANLKEFIQLCCLIPIPAAKWLRMMKHSKKIEKYLAMDTELPMKLIKTFQTYFERYQVSDHKLLMSDFIKRAVNRPPACQKVTEAPNPQIEPTTTIMEDCVPAITQ